jgi:hypothetical protein
VNEPHEPLLVNADSRLTHRATTVRDHQGSWWPLATYVPSLVSGMLHKAGGLRLTIACHAWFNLCFVLALRAG